MLETSEWILRPKVLTLMRTPYAAFHHGLHCLLDNNVQGLCSIQSESPLFAKQLQFSGLKCIILIFCPLLLLLFLSPGLVCRWWGRTIPLSHLANNLKILNCVLDKWATTWVFQQCAMCDQQKAQTSLRICAVWSEPLLVAWVIYDCKATDRTSFGVSNLKGRLYSLVWVYTCQNATLLEIMCHGSNAMNHSKFIAET